MTIFNVVGILMFVATLFSAFVIPMYLGGASLREIFLAFAAITGLLGWLALATWLAVT